MINQQDLDLFDFTDNAEDAWLKLVSRSLKEHTPECDQPKLT
jgi:hypothetical protein